jgi:hypothetical protein
LNEHPSTHEHQARQRDDDSRVRFDWLNLPMMIEATMAAA